jgi:hypothetical protein
MGDSFGSDLTAVFVELSAAGAPATARQELIAGFMRERCADLGTRFVELSHRAVRSKPRHANALMLLRPLLRPVGTADLIKAGDAVAGGPAKLEDVEASACLSRRRILSMVRAGELAIEGSGPITGSSLVGPPSRHGALR